MSCFIHRYSLICEKGIIDNVTNNISLINIMEELSVSIRGRDYQALSGKEIDKEEFVVVPFLFEIVSFWENRGYGKILDVQLDFLAPSGKVLNEFFPTFKFDHQKERLRTTFKVDGLKLNKESGVYNYIIKYRDKKSKKYEVVAKIPLIINFNVA